MKNLFALGLLLVSGTTLGQAVAWPYAAEERIYWIEGETVNITYSHTDAPATVSYAQATQVLADVEAFTGNAPRDDDRTVLAVRLPRE